MTLRTFMTFSPARGFASGSSGTFAAVFGAACCLGAGAFSFSGAAALALGAWVPGNVRVPGIFGTFGVWTAGPPEAEGGEPTGGRLFLTGGGA